MLNFKKAIHLLYAPTPFCNMSCQYCYLGELTEQQPDKQQIIETLKLALTKLYDKGYLAFNLSFHGGEVTTLSSQLLAELFAIAQAHYANYGNIITEKGFPLNPLHIKTNLLNFNKHYATFIQYTVSISASIDLPLKLHEKYRRDKNGNSTLERIIANLKQLATYPHHKKISCVVTKEHLNLIDEFIADIHFIHDEIGLDMSRFNIMFAFDAPLNEDKFGEKISGTEMLNESEQVEFYYRIKQAFINTPLAHAFKTEWFKEFTPDYCCSAVNCGDKFFLLQSNGDVYSCPRGQASLDYQYGNIYREDIDDIIENGWKVIERNENRLTVSEDCMHCAYMPYCNVGCTFVRQHTGLIKSYTCQLQQVLYRENPEKYPPLATPEAIENYTKHWLLRNNLQRLTQTHHTKKQFLSDELSQAQNNLLALIETDKTLQQLYADDLLFLQIDNNRYFLRSPLLKNERDIELFTPDSSILLGVRADIFTLASEDLVNNHLLLMLLRDTTVVYGDEQRQKQEHIADYAIYYSSFIKQALQEDNYYLFDISAFITQQRFAYLPNIYNNLFFTTRTLREYHYTKQRKNAFYHIQAMNLPFHNIEFLWQA